MYPATSAMIANPHAAATIVMGSFVATLLNYNPYVLNEAGSFSAAMANLTAG